MTDGCLINLLASREKRSHASIETGPRLAYDRCIRPPSFLPQGGVQRDADKKEKVGASPGEGHLILPFWSFYLGRRVALARAPVGFPLLKGWPKSHGHRLTLLFTARACLTAAPDMGNIAHLARLLGAVMPQRPVLWQAINVPREKQRESD